MKNKKPVDKKSTDSKPDKDLPGYPHYPSNEDILSNEKRVDADIDSLASGKNDRTNSTLKKNKAPVKKSDNSPEIIKGTSADVTKSDLKNLGRKDRDMDLGEDEELLPDLEVGPDLSGDDLDIPGSDLDDDWEDIGSEDEENNYYSRGQN